MFGELKNRSNMTKEGLEELNGDEIELKWKGQVRVKTAWSIWRLLLFSRVHIEGTEEEAKKSENGEFSLSH